MPYLVGPKGQVVIAKEIRERLGIRPGWRVIQRLVDDHVELYFLPHPIRPPQRPSPGQDPGHRFRGSLGGGQGEGLAGLLV